MLQWYKHVSPCFSAQGLHVSLIASCVQQEIQGYRSYRQHSSGQVAVFLLDL